VRDQLGAAGWAVEVADARKVKALAPLTAKADKVDARLLAELSRRDLVPAPWVPPLDERALRERLRRRMHLVRLRTSAKGRVFGLQTQWGLRISLERCTRRMASELLERRGMPEVWRRSIEECLAVVDFLDERLQPLEAELRPFARLDPRAVLLDTIPGVGELLALTPAVEIGDVARFPRRASSLATPGSRPGSSSPASARAPAGSRRGGRLYVDVTRSTGEPNSAKAAIVRKIPTAAWHMLTRDEPFKPRPLPGGEPVPASSREPLAA
jgi:transposase